MTETVRSLAEKLKVSDERVIEALVMAGIEGKTAEDEVSAEERGELLKALRPGRSAQAPSGQGADKKGIHVEVKPARRRAKPLENRRRKLATAPVEEPELLQEEPLPEIEKIPEEEASSEILPDTDDKEVDEAPAEEAKEDQKVEAKEVEEAQPVQEAQAPQADPVVEEKPTEPVLEPQPEPKKSKQKKRQAKKELQLDESIEFPRKKSLTGQRARAISGNKHGFQEPAAPRIYEVELSELISVSDLAQAMSVKSRQVVKLLEDVGNSVEIESMLDRDTAKYVVEEMGHIAKDAEPQVSVVAEEDDDREHYPRMPVVTVMGHVDHGKTTLLDYMRRTKVASGEKGGITQHIGAYVVDTPNGKITFLDTPGHEAFSAMRGRGARLTDIVVLVVAADDGVMPQTAEVINLARVTEVPLVVAVNKMDKPGADSSKVASGLTEYGVAVEALGGDVLMVEISALTGQGVDNLLDTVRLQADMLDLVAPTEGKASGVVIEARIDKGRGPVATVLVKKGTLSKGEYVVAGRQYGKLRAMKNDQGQRVDSAGPSLPVEIEGLGDVPDVGDAFVSVPTKKLADELIEFRRTRPQQTDARFGEFWNGNKPKVLNLVVKADVVGSADALSTALERLSDEEIKVKVVHRAVGGINQNDVDLAETAEAVVIGFNVRADATVRSLIEKRGIQVYYHNVVYDAINDIQNICKYMAEPDIREEVVGTVEVREVFVVPKVGSVAGCYVVNGLAKRNLPVRVLRDQVVVHSGTIDSLRRFKNDVPEVKAGFECGISIRNFHDIKIADQLEVYQEIEVN